VKILVADCFLDGRIVAEPLRSQRPVLSLVRRSTSRIGVPFLLAPVSAAPEDEEDALRELYDVNACGPACDCVHGAVCAGPGPAPTLGSPLQHSPPTQLRSGKEGIGCMGVAMIERGERSMWCRGGKGVVVANQRAGALSRTFSLLPIRKTCLEIVEINPNHLCMLLPISDPPGAGTQRFTPLHHV
jgi:hypothetical protein